MSENLTDRDFVIYSEQYLEFTAEDTSKLFSLMSFDEFVGFLQEKHLLGFNQFLRENGIEPKTITI